MAGPGRLRESVWLVVRSALGPIEGGERVDEIPRVPYTAVQRAAAGKGPTDQERPELGSGVSSVPPPLSLGSTSASWENQICPLGDIKGQEQAGPCCTEVTPGRSLAWRFLSLVKLRLIKVRPRAIGVSIT